MSSSKTLGSPIQMPHRTSRLNVPSVDKDSAVNKEREFVKYGHPYKAVDRFFVGLEPQWSGINAVEFTEGLPVSYVKKLKMAGGPVQLRHLAATSHRNLVNLREVFISGDTVFFVYERWGISTREIGQLWRVFQLGEVEVATLCNEVLQGLKYIHDELGLSHGGLREESIYIMENGDVKIANIGESMVQSSKSPGKQQDVQAVCDLAGSLLRLDKGGARGTMGLLARDFAGAPCSATIDELLQHPFLKIKGGSWCLRPVNILGTIAQELQVTG